MHSASVQNSDWQRIGCVVKRPSGFLYYRTPNGFTFDECHIDKSGRWLVLLQARVNGGRVNRIVDTQTGQTTLIEATEGALGHLDTGYGYAVGADTYNPLPNATILLKFPVASTKRPIGPVVHYNKRWDIAAANHIAHGNAVAGLPPESQYACGSNASSTPDMADEIVCFPARRQPQHRRFARRPGGGAGDDRPQRPGRRRRRLLEAAEGKPRRHGALFHLDHQSRRQPAGRVHRQDSRGAADASIISPQSPWKMGQTPFMKTILVVDDEPSIAQIAGDYLRHGGFGVITAPNGVDALALARAQRPDLVVLDLGLPRMDGLDVARDAAPRVGVPIIMLTARSTNRTDCRPRAGADDYITNRSARASWSPVYARCSAVGCGRRGSDLLRAATWPRLCPA